MKRLLIAAALALVLTTSCSAQKSGLGMQIDAAHPPQDYSMDALLAARATLIQRYVQSAKVAARVSVCGTEDLLTGDIHSYLCVYVYRDSLEAFVDDFVNFATEDGNKNLVVGGVPVAVTLVGPVNKIEKQPNVQPQPTNPKPTSKI